MKSKCSSLWTSIWITVATLLMVAAFQFIEFPQTMYRLQNFCVVLLLSAVSGSLVAVVVFIDEYRNEKRNTLEKYLAAANETIYTFQSLRYFFTKDSIDLIKRYFDEEAHNLRIKELCDQLQKTVSDSDKENDVSAYTPVYVARYEWCKLVEPTYLKLKDRMEPESYQKTLEEAVARKTTEYIKQIDNVIDSYIDLFNQVSFAKMDRIYGQIGFFTGKRHGNEIYKDISEPLRSKLQDIRTIVAGRFGSYKNGDDPSYSTVMQALLDVQLEIFSIEVREEKVGIVTLAYNDFYTEMRKRLEDYRAHLYGVEPQYPERFYIRSSVEF